MVTVPEGGVVKNSVLLDGTEIGDRVSDDGQRVKAGDLRDFHFGGTDAKQDLRPLAKGQEGTNGKTASGSYVRKRMIVFVNN